MMIFPAMGAFSRIRFQAVNISLAGYASGKRIGSCVSRGGPSGRDLAESFWNSSGRDHVIAVPWLPGLFCVGGLEAVRDRSAARLLEREEKGKSTVLARIIHDGSSRNRAVAMRDRRAERRGREAYLKQYVDRPSGEPACLDAGPPRPGLSQRRIRDWSRNVHE